MDLILEELETSPHRHAVVWRAVRRLGPLTTEQLRLALVEELGELHYSRVETLADALRFVGWLDNGPPIKRRDPVSGGHVIQTWVARTTRRESVRPLRVAPGDAQKRVVVKPKVVLDPKLRTQLKQAERLRLEYAYAYRDARRRLTDLCEMAHKARYSTVAAEMGAALALIEEEARSIRDLLTRKRSTNGGLRREPNSEDPARGAVEGKAADRSDDLESRGLDRADAEASTRDLRA